MGASAVTFNFGSQLPGGDVVMAAQTGELVATAGTDANDRRAFVDGRRRARRAGMEKVEFRPHACLAVSIADVCTDGANGETLSSLPTCTCSNALLSSGYFALRPPLRCAMNAHTRSYSLLGYLGIAHSAAARMAAVMSVSARDLLILPPVRE